MTLKIRLISDTHLEFDLDQSHKTRLADHDAPRPRYLVWDPGNTPADVLVLAGDIMTFEMLDTYDGHFIEWMADRCADYEMVLWIPGNHEYYGMSFLACQRALSEWSEQINAVAKAKGYKGTFYLGDRYTIIKDDVKFICATLWTDFRGGNPLVMQYIQQGMNDYQYINFDKAPLRIEQLLAEHQESRAFIEKEIDNYDGKIVVVSHHQPSYQTILDEFRGDPLNDGYASDLDHLVERVDLWMAGHMHSTQDIRIGDNPLKGRLIRNPRGYFHYRMNEDFNSDFVVDI
jgi:hypothetical protein